MPRAARKVQSSTLARLLNEFDKRSANPFFEYSRFNGDVSSILPLSVCDWMDLCNILAICTFVDSIIHTCLWQFFYSNNLFSLENKLIHHGSMVDPRSFYLHYTHENKLIFTENIRLIINIFSYQYNYK